MTPLLFDIGPAELFVLVALAVILLGPEKVPPLAKKAGRIIRFLRGVANTAADQVKAELGPDFADLNMTDLKPANLIRQIVSEGDQAELTAMRAEIDGMRTDLAKMQLISGRPVRRPAPVVPTVLPAASPVGPVESDRADQPAAGDGAADPSVDTPNSAKAANESAAAA